MATPKPQPPSAGDGATAPPLMLREVLQAELEQILQARGSQPKTSTSPAEKTLEAVQAEMNSRKLSALCLSGGGIRSATFALGVVQALARSHLLEEFDYLSTVSGGGYIGSWLSAWRKHTGKDIYAISHQLRMGSQTDVAPAPVTRLRDFTSYLSPELGLFSADTWTMVAIFARNLLLNWTMFLPVLAALLLVPRLFISLIQVQLPQLASCSLLVIGGVLQAWAMSYLDCHRPGARGCFDANDTQGSFLRWCFLWFVLGVILISLGWAGLMLDPIVPSDLHASWQGEWVPPAWVAGRWPTRGLAGFWGLLAVIGSKWIIGALTFVISLFRCHRQWPFRRLAVELVVTMILAAPFSGWLLWVFAKQPLLDPRTNPCAYACCAVPVYLLVFLLAGTLLRGLLSFWSTDADREWSARAAAWFIMAMVFWIIAFAVVVYGPAVLEYFKTAGLAAFYSAGGLSGALIALLGGSAKTPANADEARKMGTASHVRQIVLALAAPAFILFLVFVVAIATDGLLTRLWTPPTHLSLFSNWLGGLLDRALVIGLPKEPLQPGHHTLVLLTSSPVMLLAWLAGFALVAGFMSFFVDINTFSLHGADRDRLIRAYLGASRKDRESSDTYNRFTGFDRQDDFPIYQLPMGKPFHVLNMTLNLVHGRRLAWQQRKAETFTATRLHCGSASLLWPPSAQKQHLGAYRRSAEYGGGDSLDVKGHPQSITLGSAMAISGAAASPNMGYNSSPAITFLMTLFNVRLGVWLGNPGPAGNRCDAYKKRSPRIGLWPLVQEALGLTDDENAWVNLSDGGHFDNLGLYEMVLRRCRRILVIDAGADPDCGFADLGNAVRKIYIDMGVPITFKPRIAIFSRNSQPKPARAEYFALARIGYSTVNRELEASGGGDGCILYIKPAFYGAEPVDIYNYARGSAEFPHESTADQFFTESQFESYRNLGAYILTQIWESEPAWKGQSGSRGDPLDKLFDRANAWLG